MFDLIEGKKVVTQQTSGGSVAAGNKEFVNMENMHYIWVLATFRGSSGPVLHTQVAEDYAGTSSSSAANATQVWTCYDSTTLDRFTKSTALFVTFDDGNSGAAIMRFDPASVPASSNTHFGVYGSSYVGALGISYIAEPRYAGSQQFIATTSST